MNHYIATGMTIDRIGFYRIGIVLGLWFWRKVGGIRALTHDDTILYHDIANECLILVGTDYQMRELSDAFSIRFKKASQKQQDAFLGWFYG